MGDDRIRGCGRAKLLLSRRQGAHRLGSAGASPSRARLWLGGVIVALCFVGSASAGAPPYIGEWSNGRGETLTVTKTTIRFNADPAVPYRDITRAGDDKSFQLEITTAKEVNGFGGKFLRVSCEDDEMQIVTFASRSDLLLDKNPGSDVTWYSDSSD